MTGDRPGVFCWRAGLEPLGKPLEAGEKESTREETYESGMLKKRDGDDDEFFLGWGKEPSSPPALVALYLLSVAYMYVIPRYVDI